MKVLNVSCSGAVMACVVTISFVHSLELFRAAGFDGYLAYLGVLAVEITFVLAALNIIVARLKNRPAGIPSYMGGVLGIGLVGWSNVSATAEYGWPGIILGLFIPAALITSESIMSYAVLRQRKREGDERSANRETADKEKQPAKKPRKQSAKQTAAQPANISATKTAGQSANKPDSQPAKQPADQTANQTAEQTDGQTDGQPAESPYEMAVRYYREHGRLPSQRVLAGMAGCTRYKASVVLDELKKKVVAM